MLGSVVSLAACGDLRPPIVWNGQTDDSEQNVVACLKRRVVFDKVAFVKVRAKAGSKATRTYILSSKVTLHFDHAKRDIDRIFVRADRELSQTEKNGLSRCARYPDNPISPLDPLSTPSRPPLGRSRPAFGQCFT